VISRSGKQRCVVYHTRFSHGFRRFKNNEDCQNGNPHFKPALPSAKRKEEWKNARSTGL
jgi:hypothetical protein